ncbi:MAG: efflux RND transporter permease subunit [Candidatus Melainabacteria bacterium]|nr:efflux RND transporter permease subunit [Candidatus Melainabacteria bacterium]
MNSWIDKLINSALKGRYLTLAATVLVVIAGLVAVKMLPLEAYPELTNPQVRVITLYPGKGPEEVERIITVPLEKELNGIPGQTSLRSLSLYGLSVVTTTFVESTPTALARQQVLERLAQSDIPGDAHPHLEPDVGSLREIFRYCLYSPYYSAMGMRSIQQWELEKLFRQIPGVIGVISEGGRTKAYEVDVNQDQLKAYQITLHQVFDSLSKANATSGGGFIEKSGTALIVRELGLLQGIDDIESVVVSADKKGTPIRIRDVAKVKIGYLVRRGQVGKNTEDDVVEGILLLRRGENPSQVLGRVYERLPEIIKRLPPGVRMEVLYDRMDLINQTIQTIRTNIQFGIGLVIVLLCLFLLDIPAAIITAIPIPLAMLVAFICLNLFGVPANLLSLGAIDFGILVDSSVVMVENIIRRLAEEGRDLSRNHRLMLLDESAREVGAPILFGIAVIVATFLPIFTFQGVEGKLFRPLATTMVCALLGAGLVALTLVPVLCSLILTRKPITERKSPLIKVAEWIYRPTLKWALKVKGLVILLATVAFLSTSIMFQNIGSEFLPHLEEGNIWLRATVKPGSVTLEESVKVARKIRERLLQYPEVTTVLSQVGGPDDGTDPAKFGDQEFYVGLKPTKEWRPQFHETKDQLIASMKKELEELPGVGYYFTQYIQTTVDEALSGVQGSLVAKISGPDLYDLEKLGHKVGSIMDKTPGIVDVIVDPLVGQPQFAIKIDRDAAARYQLNVDDLKRLVEIAIAGASATKVIEGEKKFDLIVRLAPEYRATEESLSDIFVDTPQGKKVPLSQFATLKEVTGAVQIWREQGSRLATIRANVRGRDLATAVEDAQARVNKEVSLPPGYQVAWSGEFQRQKEASHQLAIVVPVTLVVIITILYLSCGTFRGATVMFSVVPLASIGAVLAMYMTNTYMSISAGVGFIALFGLAVKNGILLVSFVNELRQEGLPIEEAVYKGAMIRLRPVLMTAVIAAAGLLPAALSNEIGSQTQKPFAIVIIGGLVSCTLLTLYVLPVLYIKFQPRATEPGLVGNKVPEAAPVKVEEQ